MASGSIRKVVLDGLPFPVAADSNATINASPFEKEGQPTSGETMLKVTIRTPTIEGIVLQPGAADERRLYNLSLRTDFFPVALTEADGTVWQGRANVNYENQETESKKAPITLIPDRSIGAWTKFVAS